MSHLFCPECEEALDPGKSSCNCGWVEKPKKGSKTSKRIPNTTHVCGWHHDGNHCPLPSSINTGTLWYCQGHYRNTNNPQAGIDHYNKVNELIKGKANELHHHLIDMHRKSTYWDVDDHKRQVLKIDHEQLMIDRVKSPDWVHWCMRKLASLILTDLEKYANDHITHEELARRIRAANPEPEPKPEPEVVPEVDSNPETKPEIEDTEQADDKELP